MNETEINTEMPLNDEILLDDTNIENEIINDITSLKVAINELPHDIKCSELCECSIRGLNTKIDTLILDVNKKAYSLDVQKQIDSINEDIKDLLLKLDTKASKTELLKKADKTYVDNLSNNINIINTALTDLNNKTINLYIIK